ncbi:MAG: DNA primase [Roseinatronobacter sp.]
MSLPPGFLDELRNRVSLASIVGRKVTWDMRKSNQAKGDLWAPCPFHQEKSASFHIDDRKGYYYCFGCHAKGDALKFVQETDNLSFMEAVEMLAREAGMTMPARDPMAAEKADHLSSLAQVMEQAVRFFRMQLRGGQAAEARSYLTRRGLDEAALERFEIGFAGTGRQALWSHLTGAGVTPAQIVEAGLAIAPDDGSAPYDRFRNRIMFPIRDARGRCIAFGGRAMAEGVGAKYLNSPETPLFDKGRSLYNHGPARSAVGKDQPLIVAEGYMDVIALVRAGFEGAVAPLGTAITDEQLRMIWRISPEPIIALDGDTAGLRAGYRLMELALPYLGPEQSMRFCLLPAKQDPDDVFRAGGAAAMRKLLDGAVPLVQLLWQRETEGQVFDSPERRAALDKRLRGLLAKIADQGLRAHYADEIRALRAGLFGATRPRRDRTAPKDRVPVAAHATTRATLLASADGLNVAEQMREEIVVATLLRHRDLVRQFEAELDRVEFQAPLAQAARTCLLGQTELPAALAAELAARPHVQIAPPVRSPDPDFAALCLTEEFAKLFARRGWDAELRDALADLDRRPDEGLTWRLAQAADARARSERSNLNDQTDLGEDRAALKGQLDRLIESQVWVKRRK